MRLIKRHTLAYLAAGALLATSSAAWAAPLRVLSFNVWKIENTEAGRTWIVDVVRASGADVVGFQELNHSRKIAEALRWHLHVQSDHDAQIVSRYPIVAVSPGGHGARLQLPSGRQVWLFNEHLPAMPYQPYDLRDGKLPHDEATVIQAAHAARGKHVARLLDDIRRSGALAAGLPVIITGDFNEPSHLDWTESVAAATERPYDLKIAWPVSTQIAALGFADSFRTLRPDAINDRGDTWTPGQPPPKQKPGEVHDRIDIVYYAGPGIAPRFAQNIGHDAGNPNTDVQLDGYPFDHRAVVVAFDLGSPRPPSRCRRSTRRRLFGRWRCR